MQPSKFRLLILILLFLLPAPLLAQDAGHVWTDSSGNYKLKADLIARNDSSIVVRLEDKSMLIVEIAQLSELDQQYLRDLETELEKAKPATTNESSQKNETDTQSDDTEAQNALQCWRLTSGNTICGNVVEYGRRLVQIKKRGSRIYVNDQLFPNLPDFYQEVVIGMVNNFEKLGSQSIKDEKQLLRLLSSKPKRQSAYTVEGVLIEDYRGDIYGVPFFMFEEAVVNAFKSGWDQWLAAEEDAKYQAEMSLRLRVEAMMRQRKEQAEFNLQRLHVFLEGYNAGLFDLWQVDMYPPRNSNGFPLRVIVPARDSGQARTEASRRYPKLSIGATSKVRRKWR